MEQRGRRLIDAFVAALRLREHLREGTDFCTALTDLTLQIETLEDGYPEWHPASYPFRGMLKLFLYLKIAGDSYRSLARRPELADVFGLKRIPDESVLSRTWRNRFDDDVRGYIITSAHLLIKEVHNEDLAVPEVRPLEEVKQSPEEATDSAEDATNFSDEEIYRTTRIAREHGFNSFDSGRAQNATYEDTRFFELQTFFGTNALQAIIEGSPQPWVSANVTLLGIDIPGSIVVERNDGHIGISGVTAPGAIGDWLDGVKSTNPVDAAQQVTDRLQRNCDSVVLLDPFSPLFGLFCCERAGDLSKISFHRIIE